MATAGLKFKEIQKALKELYKLVFPIDEDNALDKNKEKEIIDNLKWLSGQQISVHKK